METVVIVLTDVQGSTKLWQDESLAMDVAMARHHEIVHAAVAAHEGWRPVDQGEGDAVFAAFRSVSQAVEAVVRVQRELAAEPWPTAIPLRVRIGVHLGEVTERGGNLYGDPVNRCARLRGLGSGGQTLLSSAVYEQVRDKLPQGTALADLGEHRMKDLVRPERVWQLNVDGLESAFPTLTSLDAVLHNLPLQRSPLIGRNEDLARVARVLGEHRLVTLTGFGGMGKTRLALQVAAELVDDFPDGVWFVDLAELTDPEQVPGAVARAAGIKAVDAEAVTAELAGTRTLLVLDNLEQVLGTAPFVASLLDAAADVRVLATSRAPLRIQGEHEIALSPLALPPQGGVQDAARVSAFAAVQLFIERACAVREDFVVTNDNAPAVAEICHRLDGHPLAIELAAARVKMMTPQALLPRLDKALSVLTGGSRDMPDRHQTLRATIAWSYDNLSSDEQLLLQRMSVLPTDADFNAIEAVCGADLDMFDVLASMVDKSLVRVLPTTIEDRYGLLSSIRAYAAEQITPDQIAVIQQRHFDWYTMLFRPAPPIRRAEVQRQNKLLLLELDHLAACFEFGVRAGDERRVRDFPPGYGGSLMWDLGDLVGGAHVLEVIVRSSEGATTQLAEALFALVSGANALGAVVVPAHAEHLREVARELDRPDVSLLALGADYAVRLRGEPAVLAHIQAMNDLLARVPADSPFSADWLHDLVDNMTFVWLADIDPEAALTAARRNEASGSMDTLGEANLAYALNRVGLDAEVIQRYADKVAAGVPRLGRSMALSLARAVAMSAVACGDAPKALAVLQTWGDYVAGLPAIARAWDLRIEAYAWLESGDAQRALDALVQISADLHSAPGVAMLFFRAHRLLSGETSTEDVDKMLEVWREADPSARRRETYLSLLVERAVREPNHEWRRELAGAAEEERGAIHIPWGYQADLDRLLAQP